MFLADCYFPNEKLLIRLSGTFVPANIADFFGGPSIRLISLKFSDILIIHILAKYCQKNQTSSFKNVNFMFYAL
jgi:hypothetical protein